MSEIILAALLREWLGSLISAIDGLEALPLLRDGRKTVDIAKLPELEILWDIRGSMDGLIDRLEDKK